MTEQQIKDVMRVIERKAPIPSGGDLKDEEIEITRTTVRVRNPRDPQKLIDDVLKD